MTFPDRCHWLITASHPDRGSNTEGLLYRLRLALVTCKGIFLFGWCETVRYFVPSRISDAPSTIFLNLRHESSEGDQFLLCLTCSYYWILRVYTNLDIQVIFWGSVIVTYRNFLRSFVEVIKNLSVYLFYK